MDMKKRKFDREYKQMAVERSMSRIQDCRDNEVTESFLKTLEVKNIYPHNNRTSEEAELSVFIYFEACRTQTDYTQ